MKIKIDNFEGPLDLLLQLIEKEELDITQVSLLSVAEQYISYLDSIEKKEPEMLADFLLIAAKLLYIKSRVLLPELELDTEDDSIDLANQLRMYKKFVDASKIVRTKFENPNFAYTRPIAGYKKLVKYEPSKNLNAGKLKSVFVQIVRELDEIAKLPKKSLERVVSIKEKIRSIQKLLTSKDNFRFSEIMEDVSDKTEIIISFLGLLELSKQRELALDQSEAFGDIQITKIQNA